MTDQEIELLAEAIVGKIVKALTPEPVRVEERVVEGHVESGWGEVVDPKYKAGVKRRGWPKGKKRK